MDKTMDNQQVTQTDLAWLAGIWDGEGYFSIRRTVLKSTKRPQYSPRLGVVNSNTQILNKVRKILNALNIKYYFREKGQGAFEGSKKQVWLIAVETMSNAIRLITAIRPYLVGKWFQADCISEYCEKRISKYRNGRNPIPYTEREFELVQKVFEANGDIRGTSETIVRDAQRAMI